MSDLRADLRLPFRFARTPLAAEFADAVRSGKLFGTRCPSCEKVFVPPRAFCARCWESCAERVPVADHGVVTTFVVVNVPFHGQQIAIPYVLAHVLLEGADSTLLHVVGRRAADGTLEAPDERALGMRVQAIWRPRGERTGAINDDVEYFEPV